MKLLIISLVFVVLCLSWLAPDIAHNPYEPNFVIVRSHPEILHWGKIVQNRTDGYSLSNWYIDGTYINSPGYQPAPGIWLGRFGIGFDISGNYGN